MKNANFISKGFEILRGILAPYIGRELSSEYGSNIWWRDGVLKAIRDNRKSNLPQEGDFATVTDSLDIAACLLLIADIHWDNIFKGSLSRSHRTWMKELQIVRDKTAHIGGVDFSDIDTWRALDTMSRLCESLDSESAEEIRGLVPIPCASSADNPINITESSPNSVDTKDQNHAVSSGSAFDFLNPNFSADRGKISNLDKILGTLATTGKMICDDCLSDELHIAPRQQVNQICNAAHSLGKMEREKGICHICKKDNKFINFIGHQTDESILEKDGIYLFKIHKYYREGMSPEELKDTTRGMWPSGIPLRTNVYGFAIADYKVIEVYKIERWNETGKTKYIGRPVLPGRYEFEGSVAPESIRNQYVGKTIKRIDTQSTWYSAQFFELSELEFV